MFELIPIDADITHLHKNYTDKSSPFSLALIRELSQEDISNIELDIMPGFRLTWNYDQILEPQNEYSSMPQNEYSSDINTKHFVRYLHFVCFEFKCCQILDWSTWCI